MTFEDYLDEVKQIGTLPNTAIMQLPTLLKKETKNELLKISPAEAVRMLGEAIDEINSGCVESIDSLVRRKLGIW